MSSKAKMIASDVLVLTQVSRSYAIVNSMMIQWFIGVASSDKLLREGGMIFKHIRKKGGRLGQETARQIHNQASTCWKLEDILLLSPLPRKCSWVLRVDEWQDLHML
jgi:hypothetical protein